MDSPTLPEFLILCAAILGPALLTLWVCRPQPEGDEMSPYIRPADLSRHDLGDPLLLKISDDKFEHVTFLEGAEEPDDPTCVVEDVAGLWHVRPASMIYEEPIAMVDDFPVYCRDTLFVLATGEKVIVIDFEPDNGWFLTSGGDTVDADVLTVKMPEMPKVGYIALDSVYGYAPPEVVAGVSCREHVFVSEAMARKIHPHAEIVKIAWSKMPTLPLYKPAYPETE